MGVKSIIFIVLRHVHWNEGDLVDLLESRLPYQVLWTVHVRPNSYVEALSPNVIIFGDGEGGN